MCINASFFRTSGAVVGAGLDEFLKDPKKIVSAVSLLL